MTVDVVIRGETLRLFPEKAVLWRRTLLVADAHFGKAATFRRAGIPIPVGTTAADLDRLSRLVSQTSATRLFFLGDFAHEGGAMEEKARARVKAWRAAHAALEATLIVGNHDRAIAGVARELSLGTAPHITEGPFTFQHEPPSPGTTRGAYVLAGHIHPGVRLEGEGGDRLRAPCFWFAETFGVLPAFGGFTGLYDVRPGPRDGVVVVGDGELALLQPPRFEKSGHEKTLFRPS